MPRTRLIKRKGPRRKGKPHHGDRHFGKHIIEEIETRRKSYQAATRAVVPDDDTGFVEVRETDGSIFPYGAPQLSTTKSLHVSVPVTPRMPQQKRRPETVVQYTEEAVKHANYLLNTQGRAAMEDYLKGAKSMIEQTVLKPNGNHGTTIQEAGGTIETALHEAAEKADYHRKQSEHHQGEEQRWKTVADSLQIALDASRGTVKTSKSKPVSGTGSGQPRGFWREQMHKVGAGKVPMTRKDWVDKMQAAAGYEDRAPVYAAMMAAIKKGELIECGGDLLGLAEWTNPGGAA